MEPLPDLDRLVQQPVGLLDVLAVSRQSGETLQGGGGHAGLPEPDHASARLVWLALNSKDERVQLMAIKEVLDRAGLGAKQEIELSLAPWQEAIQVGGIIVDEADDETDVVVGEVVSETYDELLPALVDDPPHGISQNARLASSAQRRPARRPRQP